MWDIVIAYLAFTETLPLQIIPSALKQFRFATYNSINKNMHHY